MVYLMSFIHTLQHFNSITFLHIFIHTHIQACLSTTYVQLYSGTYIHTYIHTYMQTYINTYIHSTYIHAYIHAHTFQVFNTDIFIQKCRCIYTGMWEYLDTNIYQVYMIHIVCMYVYMYVCMYVCMQSLTWLLLQPIGA